ncbi:MAG: Wzz/FepE/Etk N-terminal domain-containing protein, partial [Bryobacteraceae bacterium]
MEPTNNQLGLRQALEERGPRNLPVALDMYRPAASNWEAEAEPPTIPLSHYLWILKRHRWKILSFVAACVAGTLIVSSRMIPIYESTAIVDIDRQMPADIIGESASRSLTNDADQFLSTQIDLIQSDSVLRPVAQQYRLREVERQEGGGEGDEEQIENAPTRLKNLKVTRPANTYLLHIRYRARDRKLAASVANAIAHSYLERTYEIRFRSSSSLAIFMEKQMDELKAKMERSGSALAQFERELNVINPEEKTSILSARLLQLNAEATNAQAERARKQS